MRSRFAIAAFLIAAQAMGLPVAQLCAAVAMISFLFGALLLTVGAAQPAQRLFAAWAGFLGLAILLPMFGAVASEPVVIGLIILLFIVLALVFGLRALGSLVAAMPERSRPARRQPALADQVHTVEGELDRDRHALPRGRRSGDDFGLLDRDRR